MNSLMSQLTRRILLPVVCLGLVLGQFYTATARAQDGPGLSLELPGELGLDGIGGGFGSVGPLVTVEASYKVRENSNDGLMELKVTVADDYHIYSTTQGRNKQGGPLPTKIKIRGNESVQVLEGAISTDKDPEIHHYEQEYGELDIEEFTGEVTFTALIQFEDGIDASKQQFRVLLEALACTNDLGQCVPQDVEVEVSLKACLKGRSSTLPNSPGFSSTTFPDSSSNCTRNFMVAKSFSPALDVLRTRTSETCCSLGRSS